MPLPSTRTATRTARRRLVRSTPPAGGQELALGLGVGFLVRGSFEDHPDRLCGSDVVGRGQFVADSLFRDLSFTANR